MFNLERAPALERLLDKQGNPDRRYFDRGMPV